MAFNFFGFGRRRKYTKRRKVGKKGGLKPSKTLVKICRRYGVKVMSGKRYKKTSVIKRQCAKRIRALIRQVKRKGSSKRKGSGRRKSTSTRRRRTRFGAGSLAMSPYSQPMPRMTRYQRFRRSLGNAGRGIYNRRRGIGRAALAAGAIYGTSVLGRAAYNKYNGEGIRAGGFKGYGKAIYDVGGRDYGRVKAGGAYVGNKLYVGGKLISAPVRYIIMKAYELAGTSYTKLVAYFKKNPAEAATLNGRGNPDPNDAADLTQAVANEMGSGGAFGKRRRRARFGNGGNPPLSMSMGSEFCSGGGGVLGANSTGLFPSPCMGRGPAMAFGKRRRRRM